MATLDLAMLTAPIVDHPPCGLDLDLEDDSFTNFMSGTEMALPDEYFVTDHLGQRAPFHQSDRFEALNLKERLAAATKYLDRTHDLRLLFLVAKLEILDKSIFGFQTVVEAVAALLETYWVDVHPRAEDGDYGFRRSTLERFDEALIISALNNAPLFRSKRYGPMTGLSYVTATALAEGAVGTIDTSSVDRLLTEESRGNPTEVVAAQAALRATLDALRRISATWQAQSTSSAPSLTKLAEAVARLLAMLVRIDPTPAPLDSGPGASESADEGAAGTERTATLAFKTRRHAVSALAATADYFATYEPSSPALLLIRQAQALVGKSFFEAVEMLMPEQVAVATVNIGTSAIFNLPLAALSKVDGLEEAEPAHVGRRTSADAQDEFEVPEVQSRDAANACLEGIGSYFRLVEPSSPIPLFMDHARNLTGRNFAALIDAMLPKDT